MNVPVACQPLSLESRIQRCYQTDEGRTALEQFQLNVGDVHKLSEVHRIKLLPEVGHYLQYGPEHAVLLDRVVNMLEVCGYF